MEKERKPVLLALIVLDPETDGTMMHQELLGNRTSALPLPSQGQGLRFEGSRVSWFVPSKGEIAMTDAAPKALRASLVPPFSDHCCRALASRTNW